MLANSQYARPVQVPIHDSYVAFAPVASVGASQLSFWSVLFSKWVIIIVVAVAGGIIVVGIAVGIAVPLALQSTSKSGGNTGSQGTSGGGNNNSTSEVYTITFNVSNGSNISVTVGQITNSADLTNLQQQLDDITASYTSQLSPCSLQLLYAEGTSDGRIITVDSLACTASCTGTCATQKSDSLIQILQNNGQTFAIDSSSTVSSMRRRLARSALLNEQNEKVAPGTIIDGRRVAEINGIVTSVSFYTDQSCIGHSIEFGAFEINSYEGSYAEFTAVAGSGPLFVNTTDFSSSSTANNKLKLIVISLCANNDEDVLNDRNCQGVQFPINSQEYFGSFSTSCSLGSVTLKNVDNTHTYVNRNSGNAFNEPIRQLHYTSLGKQDVWQIPMIIPSNVNNRRQRREQQQTMGSPPRVIFLGTYLPRICGLATFLHDIVVNYDKQFHTNSSIIAIDESGAPIDRVYPNRVIARLNQNEHDSYLNIAKLINELDNVDVLNIQHEYGLFHGQAGEWILHLIAAVKKPVVVTFHTVLQNPESIYYSITRAICSSASDIIVLSHAAHDLLVKSYQIDISKVHVVPHGIPDVPFVETLPSKRQVDFGNRVIMATFGLIGRSKGLEYAIQTMKLAVKQVPDLLYIILGVTHPLIVKQVGEEYRNELQKLINNLNLTHNVKLINKYLDHKELLTYLSAVDIYLTPYSSYNQVVSGTLSIAVGCGKAVISTPYIYAKELLAHGRGFLIPFKDDTAASQTIVKLATDTDMRDTVRRRAYKYGRKMIWSRVVIQLAHIYENTLFDT